MAVEEVGVIFGLRLRGLFSLLVLSSLLLLLPPLLHHIVNISIIIIINIHMIIMII